MCVCVIVCFVHALIHESVLGFPFVRVLVFVNYHVARTYGGSLKKTVTVSCGKQFGSANQWRRMKINNLV